MTISEREFEDYMAGAGDRAVALRTLHEVIRSSAPSFEPVFTQSMGAAMLGYGMIPCRSESMKATGEWPVVAGQYVAERYADRLGRVSCGKSCIRFKRLEDLNSATLREILRELERRKLAGEKLYAEPAWFGSTCCARAERNTRAFGGVPPIS
ncbi:hypothetical protein [Nocardia abscessus]|uniref:hypothetical protein n=1 Tax=Nocardia abscessus TaxID=120957 RepID=UPI002456458E|nr:hypothetical protein [Nocardia abscessus]